MNCRKLRTVSFKLISQFNINELSDRENFELEREYRSGDQIFSDKIRCRLLGIQRKEWVSPVPVSTFEGNHGSVRKYNSLKSYKFLVSGV